LSTASQGVPWYEAATAGRDRERDENPVHCTRSVGFPAIPRPQTRIVITNNIQDSAVVRWYDHTVDHTGGTMATTERVTVTLPAELVDSIDRYESNRSRFITEAVEHELVRRRREELLRSLKSPHPEAAELAEMGLADWGASLPSDDEGLVDMNAGKPVRWIEGEGWVEEPV
jgi:hypothetical protein